MFTSQTYYPLFSDSLSECLLHVNVASQSWLWENQGEELVIQNKLQLKTKISKVMCILFFFEQRLIIMYTDTCGYEFQH